MEKMENTGFGKLVTGIEATHGYFVNQAQRQVNTALTLRNWIIGFLIVEYEQNGSDRAEYGESLIENLSAKLQLKNLKGFSPIALRTNRNFYLCYPQIQQVPSVELYLSEIQHFNNLEFSAAATNQQIQQTLSVKSDDQQLPVSHTPPELLVNRLSFSHFIELLKFDDLLKRMFYEVEAIKNNWSVRELQRAANIMLFERTGLSADKVEVLKKLRTGEGLSPAEVFRDPYMLEFLGLAEKAEYSESDLEQAIITHLQNFLLEMGRGFCFEARQKRITFDNTHYKIDLVFYHRLLKCHVLIDLKIGEFSPADAGQMNMYLNYYIDNEMQENDNPPVGIILCAGKNENLVKYATGGLNHKVFVNRYMVNLPDAGQLKKIIEEERQKLI